MMEIAAIWWRGQFPIVMALLKSPRGSVAREIKSPRMRSTVQAVQKATTPDSADGGS